MADICVVCQKEVQGDFEVSTREDPSAFHIIIAGSADRDFNVCDSCNSTVHFKCSRYPKSGYCDPCIAKYNLYEYARELEGEW